MTAIVAAWHRTNAITKCPMSYAQANPPMTRTLVCIGHRHQYSHVRWIAM